MPSDYSPFTDYVESTAIELRDEPVSAASVEQGITLNVDGSASMLDTIAEAGEVLVGMPPRTKAAAATVAAGDTVSRLQASRKASNFSVGFVAFNERVTVSRPIMPVLQVPATDDFDPTAGGTGGTCIWAGLEAAYEQILQWRQTRTGTLHVSNVVLTMSDGLCSDPQRTMAAAAVLKELPDVTLAACLFTAAGEPSQGAQLLQQIASGPRFYKTVFTGEQLREFFLASITLAGGGGGV
jgi:hypothetical protein